MAQRIVRLRGISYWARLYEGQEDEYNDKVFTKITVELDNESWEKYNKSRMKLRPRPVTSDDDAPDGITFRREVEGKMVKSRTGKDKELGGGYPKVVDKNGDEMTSDQLIGNGSLVEVKVSVYDIPSRKLVGHRLEEVKVLELVPYEPYDEDDEEEEEEPVKEEPKKKASTPATKRSSKNNDDIPF